MSPLAFDEKTGKQLESLYQTADALRRRRLVRTALGAAPGERVLDVGCGPGFYCEELVEEVSSEGFILGLDSSPQMLALAARRCAGHDNVRFAESDATALTVDDGMFDAALCVQLLEYMPDVPTVLAELHRALRPGGRVVIWDVDWSTVSWHSADPERMQRILTAWDEHLVHRALPRTLAPAMRATGFADIEMQAHSFATADFHPGTYGAANVPLIGSFVGGHNGVTEEEAQAWMDEQRELGERGEFFFACIQFCFKGTRH